MVETPVGLHGDEPITFPRSVNAGKSLTRVSMNTILFSDPHTLDPLGVKHLQEFALQGREVCSLRLQRGTCLPGCRLVKGRRNEGRVWNLRRV
jgi:hypothetical protein